MRLKPKYFVLFLPVLTYYYLTWPAVTCPYMAWLIPNWVSVSVYLCEIQVHWVAYCLCISQYDTYKSCTKIFLWVILVIGILWNWHELPGFQLFGVRAVDWQWHYYRVSHNIAYTFVFEFLGIEIPSWTFFNSPFRVNSENIQFFIILWNLDQDIGKVLQGDNFKS